MSTKLFPPDDRSMTIRLKRQIMGLLSYMMFLIPLVYSVHNHWVDFSMATLGAFTAAAMVVNLVFFLLIRSGWSLRLQDPSMTLAQMVSALSLALLMIRYADQARPILLMLFFTCFFFGIFGLSRRQFWALATATIVGYAIVVGSEFLGHPERAAQFKMEVLQFITLSMILCWMSIVGGYVASLRLRVASQKEQLASAVERLSRLVSYDELTGVFNRRHLMEIVKHEKACSDRHLYAFSVCLLDIDNFKKINDEYGHQVGDEVLKVFSERMRLHARGMDWIGRGDDQSISQASRREEGSNNEVTFGRYGGEEFMVVMPHTKLMSAARGMERLRAGIQDTPMPTTAGPVSVTFSAGVAEHRPRETVDAAIARADKALYLAKSNGRNRTEMAENPVATIDQSPPAFR